MSAPALQGLHKELKLGAYARRFLEKGKREYESNADRIRSGAIELHQSSGRLKEFDPVIPKALH